MLRMEFDSDSDALIVLKPNITQCKNGVLRIPLGYEPTKTEWDAINYLMCEWDFTYEREE